MCAGVIVSRVRVSILCSGSLSRDWESWTCNISAHEYFPLSRILRGSFPVLLACKGIARKHCMLGVF